ncbi:MAG: hypothetical protein HC880_18415, partial [Bacteroidia bacterium]|nr:hypothetical protein [Bacteroidia bacterium]
LLKTYDFLRNLNPECVFQQYKNVPEDELYQKMTLQAHRNLKVAREYMRVKLVAATILEALALTTGGDIPMSMMIGEIRQPRQYQEIERAEDYLPAVNVVDDLPYNPSVLKLLEFGRTSQLSFDLQNAPISYFVYALSGRHKIQQYTQLAQEMFAHQISEETFLSQVDKEIVSAIARACAEVALTRRDRLKKYFE